MTVDVILERTEATGKPRYIGISPVVDGAGNIFVGMAQTKGVGTAFIRNVLIIKIGTDGHKTIIDERDIPNGHTDGVGIVQSGNLLHVFAGAHIGDPTARLYHYTLPVCVPYPEGQHTGMSGAYVPTEEPEVEVDYTRIQNMINVLGAALPGIARQAVRDELAAKGVLTEAMFAGGSGSYTVYQQLLNTSYSGAMAALAEHDATPQEEFAVKVQSMQGEL